MKFPITNDTALIAAAILMGAQPGTADSKKLKELVEIADNLRNIAYQHT